MHKEVEILLAEDDDGHASLIQRNLQRAGLTNPVRRFVDGQEIIEFLGSFQSGPSDPPTHEKPAYLLLLDINMPKVDGIGVLRWLKNQPGIKKIPAIMVTTTDDPREIEKCHELGCSSYVTKPVDYDKFVHAIRQLGLFLAIVEVPTVT